MATFTYVEADMEGIVNTEILGDYPLAVVQLSAAGYNAGVGPGLWLVYTKAFGGAVVWKIRSTLNMVLQNDVIATPRGIGSIEFDPDADVVRFLWDGAVLRSASWANTNAAGWAVGIGGTAREVEGRLHYCLARDVEGLEGLSPWDNSTELADWPSGTGAAAFTVTAGYVQRLSSVQATSVGTGWRTSPYPKTDLCTLRAASYRPLWLYRTGAALQEAIWPEAAADIAALSGVTSPTAWESHAGRRGLAYQRAGGVYHLLHDEAWSSEMLIAASRQYPASIRMHPSDDVLLVYHDGATTAYSVVLKWNGSAYVAGAEQTVTTTAKLQRGDVEQLANGDFLCFYTDTTNGLSVKTADLSGTGWHD